MQKERLERYERKKVFLILKGGLKYTGTITSIDEDCFSFVDKFGNNMIISFDDLAMIQEQNGGLQ